MIGKAALGTVCSGILLVVAVRSNNEMVQTLAAVAGAGCVGYSATTLLVKRHRDRKLNEAHAEFYLDLLRQMHHQQAQADAERPIACQGCSHYHGQRYGGNLLVCGMHPYGVEDDHCSDWETHAATPGRDSLDA